MDDHAWCHKNLSPNPRTILDNNGAISIWEGDILIVVISRAKKRTLGYTTIRTNRNRLEIQNEHLFADPSVVTDA